jgi:hypothetical protein
VRRPGARQRQELDGQALRGVSRGEKQGLACFGRGLHDFATPKCFTSFEQFRMAKSLCVFSFGTTSVYVTHLFRQPKDLILFVFRCFCLSG